MIFRKGARVSFTVGLNPGCPEQIAGLQITSSSRKCDPRDDVAMGARYTSPAAGAEQQGPFKKDERIDNLDAATRFAARCSAESTTDTPMPKEGSLQAELDQESLET